MGFEYKVMMTSLKVRFLLMTSSVFWQILRLNLVGCSQVRSMTHDTQQDIFDCWRIFCRVFYRSHPLHKSALCIAKYCCK